MQKSYCREFETEDAAMSWMRTRNRSTRDAQRRDLFVVVNGPNDNFAVLDLPSAIELGGGYKWEA